MLMSLVGSEMCIRDRVAPQFEVAVAFGELPLDGLPEEVLPDASEEENGTCLLYTSDAADDLLCVDLGGRRILKKKKHRHTSTAPVRCTTT